jgi:hypothetical protein
VDSAMHRASALTDARGLRGLAHPRFDSKDRHSCSPLCNGSTRASVTRADGGCSAADWRVGGWELGWLARMNPAQQAVARARTSTVPVRQALRLPIPTCIPRQCPPARHCAPLEQAMWRRLNELRGTRGLVEKEVPIPHGLGHEFGRATLSPRGGQVSQHVRRQRIPDKRDRVKQLLPQTGSMRSIWICVVDGPCRAGSHAMSGEKRGGSSPKTKV